MRRSTPRARYVVDENVGLTITYNRLKVPGCTKPRILELRALHEQLDRAALSAYGWEDLGERVPPYCVATDADRRALEAFESKVIYRLFALNAKRAEEEKIRGLGAAAKKGKSPRAPSPKRPEKRQSNEPQLSLGSKTDPTE